MITVRRLSCRYPGATEDALAGIDWQVGPGQFALLAGQSGSGKSTLLRCLTGLIPHFHGGFFGGEVTVAGKDTRVTPPRHLARSIGTLFQDPETQLVADSLEEEVVFTLENLGFEQAEIIDRLNQTCGRLGIEHLRSRRIATLSGGERQMVALAAALAPEPGALVLDEPTSQLDPYNAASVIEALTGLNERSGLAVVIAEHRLERLLPLADTVAHLQAAWLDQRTPSAAVDALQADGLLPATNHYLRPATGSAAGDTVLEVERFNFKYGERSALRDVSLTVREGETIALTGRNGSGKTTLLKHLIGLLRPNSGSIKLAGTATLDQPIQTTAQTVGYVPQHPTIMLHQETVAEELAFTLRGLGRSGDIAQTLVRVGLAGFEDRHPLDLSGGERQRLAIAAITVGNPRLLLLDEPTRGLPWSAKHDLALLLREYAAGGAAVIVASHDEHFCRAFASRRIALDAGKVVEDGAMIRTVTRQAAEEQDIAPLLTGRNLD